MFRVVEKADEVVFQEIPVKKWLIKILLFLSCGIFVLLIADDLINLIFALGLFCLIVVISLSLNPLIITQISPAAQRIDINRRFLFFIKRTERFYFSQIKGIEIRRRKKGNADLYFNVLKLVNNSLLELQLTGTKTNSTAEIRRKLNKLIKKAKLPAVENSEQRANSRKIGRQQ